MTDLNARRLSPPPRSVPLALSIRVVLGGIGQVGWLVLGVGLIFVWAFSVDRALVNVFRFAGELQVTEATTTGWRELSLTINESTVYETSYEFEADGRVHQGVSYETGYYVVEGIRLPVEYRASDPTISRLQGMRADPAGWLPAFVLILPLVGLAVIRYGLRTGFRARRLLSEGLLAQGTLESDEATAMEVNDRPVHRLTFRFEAENGATYRVERKTHLVDLLTGDTTEAIVYDPRHPADAITIDDLPGRPVIDERGELASGFAESVAAVGNLVIPTVTVVGHGAFLYFFR